MAFYSSEHQRLLRQMWSVDRTFQRYFQRSLHMYLASIIIVALFGAILFGTFILRLVQYNLYEEVPGASFLIDSSLILVPMLSVWQLIPLVYFGFLTKILRCWFGQLQDQLRRDKSLARRSLLFYYERYLELTDIVLHLGHMFNPLLFFSLIVSMVILCLTIFFVTTAPEVLSVPSSEDDEFGFVVNVFYVIWSGLQICTAIFYVITICVSGTLTNEAARSITNTVLAVVPETERDRHVVMCFLQKAATQHGWGLTVWKAFPIERHLLFTLISIMATYAVVLLKLKQDNNVHCITLDQLKDAVNNATAMLTGVG